MKYKSITRKKKIEKRMTNIVTVKYSKPRYLSN